MKKNSIRELTVTLVLLMVMGSVHSATEINNRVSMSVDDEGMLSVESGYLTNYIVRGVDPKTGETGPLKLIKRNTKAVDFDIVDVKEWSGLFPTLDFKAPVFKKEKTKIDLAAYAYPDKVEWENSDISMRGANLVGLVTNRPKDSDEIIDAIVLFLMNTLTVAETVMEVTKSAKEAGINNPSEKLLKELKPFATQIRNFEETVKEANTVLAFTDIFLGQIERMAKAANIDLKSVTTSENYNALYSTYSYYTIFRQNVDKLAKIVGITVKVSEDDKKSAKGSIAAQYKQLLKKADEENIVFDAVLTQGVDEFAKKFEDSRTQKEKDKLVLTYAIEPLTKTLAVYRKTLQGKLKKEIKDKGPVEEIKKLQKKVDFITYGYAIMQIANFLYATDDFAEFAKKTPEKIIPALFSISDAVISKIITKVNIDVIAKTALQKVTGMDGRSSMMQIAGKSNSYMKAFQTGAGVGNKMIPLIWDLTFGENYLRTSIISKKISSYGSAKTLLQIDLNSQKIATYADGNEFYVAADEGDYVTLRSTLLRPLLFDELRSPWELNHSFVPTKLYEVNIHTPYSQINTALCGRKITGNTDFSVHQSLADINISCGEGTLLGGDAFSEDTAYKKVFTSSETLPDKYKLLHFPQSNSDFINTLKYKIISDDLVDPEATLIVRYAGMQLNEILQKIYIVPTLGAMNFDTDLAKLNASNLEIAIAIDATMLSNKDAITEVIWQWGDGQEQINLQTQASHTYSEAGKYIVTVTTTRVSGQTATLTKELDILSSLVPVTASTVSVADVSITEGDSGTNTLDFTLTFNALSSLSDTGISYTISDGTATKVDNDYDAVSGGGILFGGWGDVSLGGGVQTRIVSVTINGDTKIEPNETFTITLSNPVNMEILNATATGTIIDDDSPVAVLALNDTGITWSGNYPSGNNATCIGTEVDKQDCSYGRDAQAAAGTLSKIGAGAAGFDFTKLDSSGNTLPASASSWSCVKDNHTGLIWEVKTTDGGIHDKNNTYKWGGLTAQGRDHANKEGIYYDDWNTLVSGSNTNSFCGFSNGWRVPNRHELRSIVHLGVSNPAIDTDYFPNGAAFTVWASSPNVGGADYAWAVGLGSSGGYTHYYDRSQKHGVHLVRSRK